MEAARVPEAPLVRVEDASLRPDDGPVRVTVARLASPQAVADALAAAGARTRVASGRLTAVTTPTRLVDATGRALGAQDADALRSVLEAALASWAAPPPDLVLPTAALPCSSRTVLMGVVNVTPNSFSDGGLHYDPASHPGTAAAHGRTLAKAGADVVDVGGESTRPGASPVSEPEELERVLPVVEALAGEGIAVSVDTRKAAVARAAVDAGAVIVNDVSAGRADPQMLETVAETGAGYVLMHMRGTPETMQDDPRYEDVVAEVFDFLAEGVERAVAAGIDPVRLAIDPGIGFGKTFGHNLVLLRRLRELTSLGRPVLVGASRKSFITGVAGAHDVSDRLPGSLAAAAVAVFAGAGIIRCHDVEETAQAVRLARAVADSSA